MLKQTPLYDVHCQMNAHMADFAGWNMPLHYGSQIEEHHAVRNHAGMFDVSHMGIVDISGVHAAEFLRYLLANDIARLKKAGQALYTCMLNGKGGVLDDLIVYRVESELYRIVCNAACFAKDLAWMHKQSSTFQIQIQPRPDLAILALQGPDTLTLLKSVLPAVQLETFAKLPPFHSLLLPTRMYARTGYTGEDGVECIIPITEIVELWQQLFQHSVQPCGLAARDTLRLEAGLNLYGQDMNETTTPLESNLSWTINWQDSARDFIGRAALISQQEQGILRELVGLVLQPQGVLRTGQKVYTSEGLGEVTSGSFSPTLNKAIALARVPAFAKKQAEVERRGQLLPVIIVKPPFVRFGKPVYLQEE